MGLILLMHHEKVLIAASAERNWCALQFHERTKLEAEMILLRKNHDAAVKSNTQGGLESQMGTCYHCHHNQGGWHTWVHVQGM